MKNAGIAGVFLSVLPLQFIQQPVFFLPQRIQPQLEAPLELFIVEIITVQGFIDR